MRLLHFRASLLRTVAAGALIGGMGAGAGVARAQNFGTPGSLGMQGNAPSFSHEQLDRSLQGQRRPPSALPGAAKAEPVAPPSRVPTLMSPTEALFDAVNRGDMPGVRDAIGRGADLSATNELGLTPLDLSIDLRRSDISFLLLSMRGAAPASGAAQVQVAQSPQAIRAQELSGPTQTKAARRVMARVPAEAAGEPSLPRLFARNGGEPIPGAGFLGFDGR